MDFKGLVLSVKQTLCIHDYGVTKTSLVTKTIYSKPKSELLNKIGFRKMLITETCYKCGKNRSYEETWDIPLGSKDY